ncbi:MAG TPA: sugar phosphate isomerase/epimerase [Pseudolysinimonas sp.]
MTVSALSVQLYTVRDALAADLPGTLHRVAEIGFRNVELFGFVELADQYAELLPADGLSAPTAHAHLVGTDPSAVFAAASKIGITTLIDPHIDRSLWTAKDDVLASAKAVNELAKQGADHGLRIGYHNHWWETENRIDDVTAYEVFFDALDPEVVLEVDTYWAEVGGASAADLLRTFGDRVVAIHVKDGAVSQDDQEQTAVGSGKLDVLAILDAAPQALRVVELDGFRGDMFDALRDSFAFLTSHGVTA